MKKFSICVFGAVFFMHTSLANVAAFSIGDEREVGEKLLYSVRSSFELLDDPDITQYVTELGRSILEVAGVQYFDYRFYVINNKDFNAFAAPSGLLFFYSGLIEAMNTEDEFLSVIAHEIGHVVKRHLASRMEKGRISTIATFGLALAAIAFGGNVAPVLLTGALATGQSVNLHFSRINEEEADLLAYGWLKQLRRNPEGQARMLETMRRIARYRSEKLPQYLTTHPDPEARLNYIENLLEIDREILPDINNKFVDFHFLRFKFRMLSMIKEPLLLKNYFNNIIGNDAAAAELKVMAHYGLSQVAMQENDYDKSIQLLDGVISRFPEITSLKTDKGVCLYNVGNLLDAKQYLEEALKQDRNDMQATFYMGRLLSKEGNLEKSQEYFLRLSYNQPEYAEVYFELGKLASVQKNDDVANFYLGKYNLLQGKFDLAASSLQKGMADKTLPEDLQEEAEELLEKIKILKK